MDLSLPWFLAAIAARTAIVMVLLLFGIRIFGKRDMGGLNLLDLVLVLLLGNAVQNALTQGSGVLGVGLVSAGTLLVVSRAIGGLYARHPWLERRLMGEPTIIAADGKLDRQAMERQGVDDDELREAMRDMGFDDVEQIRLAVLEDDGEISIIPKERKE